MYSCFNIQMFKEQNLNLPKMTAYYSLIIKLIVYINNICTLARKENALLRSDITISLILY